jgi:hypothetical protein
VTGSQWRDNAYIPLICPSPERSAGMKETTALAGIEQRRQRRYKLNLPVDVQTASSASPIRTYTNDISTQGIRFLGPKALAVGSKVEWQVTLPPELCQGEEVHLHCQGRVVRVERAETSTAVAIAATIERYKFVRRHASVQQPK